MSQRGQCKLSKDGDLPDLPSLYDSNDVLFSQFLRSWNIMADPSSLILLFLLHYYLKVSWGSFSLVPLILKDWIAFESLAWNSVVIVKFGL